MVKIEGGSYIPLYGRDSAKIIVRDFLMDVYPVTNEAFLSFVKEYPTWQKDKVRRLFADDNYLNDWESPISPGEKISLKAPVTNISWFAAKYYCECQDKRLPTIDEWEYVAMADETKKDARKDSTYNQKILEWYETPRTHKKEIGNTFKNYWGVYDMHGLVWEWTFDFNSVLISGASRKDMDNDRNLFCGSAAIGANDLMNYAAFMRYAFRGSIKANFAVKNLGFRCVKDIQDPSKNNSSNHKID
ncbi:formylglycine-generating enzyme family protein [Fulvivirgaceae bacterium BMA10]|uniref:Formylglycine-generating enzyme family protein n=1 Tax=Splendidivirga corallicola TaxID=3051826 RepID=A0ABT8KGB1_9BACT|nr:formylglycine-generating enzyme family protein [Fulvivirgaceae bacterium BMA10]